MSEIDLHLGSLRCSDCPVNLPGLIVNLIKSPTTKATTTGRNLYKRLVSSERKKPLCHLVSCFPLKLIPLDPVAREKKQLHPDDA